VEDAAAAGPNAFQAEVNPGISTQMCFAHVTDIWNKKAENKYLLKNQDNMAKIKEDLNWLNTSIHEAKLAPIAVDLMLTKWRTVYKETAYAAKFHTSWGNLCFTSTQANEGGSSRVPSDNNMLESKNRVIKSELEREKPTATVLVPRITAWIETQAKCDIGFTTSHNEKVTNGTALRAAMSAMDERVVGVLDIRWPEPAASIAGSIIIPSAKTLAEAIALGCPEDKHALKEWLGKSQNRYPAWLKIFRELKQSLEAFTARAAAGKIPNFTWDFDSCCDWSSRFRLLQPVSSRLAHEILKALENNGFQVDWDVLEVEGADVFACTCTDFQHYVLCKHCLAKLWEDKLVLSWPPHRDPTRTQREKQGRPPKSGVVRAHS